MYFNKFTVMVKYITPVICSITTTRRALVEVYATEKGLSNPNRVILESYPLRCGKIWYPNVKKHEHKHRTA